MLGKSMRLLAGCLLLFMAITFFSVPFAESSGYAGPIPGVTVQPPTPAPPWLEIYSSFTEKPIDISQNSEPPARLTKGGCCSYAGWSDDSEWILFLDGKLDKTPPGLYSLPSTGGSPSFVTNRFGNFSADWSLVAYEEVGQVYVERWTDGTRWPIQSNGRAVSFSPDMNLLAWEYGSQSIQSPDRRQTQVWISTVRGEQSHELVTIHGGAFVGWVGGSEAIIVTGRLSPTVPAGIWKIDATTGAGQLLFDVEKPESILISPSGGWLVLVVAFESDVSRNGIWVLRTDGSYIERIPVFGAYRWRAEAQLLLMPLDLSAPSADLYQLDLANDKVFKLIDSHVTELKLANNDWSISPSGRWLLYHSSVDRNLWILELPELPESP